MRPGRGGSSRCAACSSPGGWAATGAVSGSRRSASARRTTCASRTTSGGSPRSWTCFGRTVWSPMEELARGAADQRGAAAGSAREATAGAAGDSVSPRSARRAGPRFGVGDTVRARNVHPAGHTRLPRYARGKRGTVIRDNGVYALQDTDGRGQQFGDFPQHVYTVRFTARELWGERGNERRRNPCRAVGGLPRAAGTDRRFRIRATARPPGGGATAAGRRQRAPRGDVPCR